MIAYDNNWLIQSLIELQLFWVNLFDCKISDLLTQSFLKDQVNQHAYQNFDDYQKFRDIPNNIHVWTPYYPFWIRDIAGYERTECSYPDHYKQTEIKGSIDENWVH